MVIGKPGKAIAVERALEHVLGYAVGLDLTLRDVQKAAKERGEPWALAKGFDGAAPVSAVVERDEVGDGSGLAIFLDVNGQRRQDGNTDQMIRGVPEIVAHASSWMKLERGDLLFTGTPAGVGPLQPGGPALKILCFRPIPVTAICRTVPWAIPNSPRYAEASTWVSLLAPFLIAGSANQPAGFWQSYRETGSPRFYLLSKRLFSCASPLTIRTSVE